MKTGKEGGLPDIARPFIGRGIVRVRVSAALDGFEILAGQNVYRSPGGPDLF